ncbi:MAG: DUF4845 domain-containing protein [Xanthomonadales bacterium]
MQRKQKGGSAIGLIIMLAILGYGLYVGLQYVPQYIESGTMDAILNNVAAKHKTRNFRSVDEILAAISKQLDVNEMNDMRDKFFVIQQSGTYVVEVSYEWELNLGFKKQPMKYEKTLTLR